jgi:hypothetical protein
MLPNSELLISLGTLDQLYTATNDTRQLKMYSKHALLELCGWIEEAQDYIVLECAKKVANAELSKLIKSKVKKNYGFHYHDNFVATLGIVVGLQKYEKIRDKLDATGVYFNNLVSTINSLKDQRNSHAHTHFQLANATTLSAPSIVRRDSEQVYEGMIELEKYLKRHKVM